MRCGHIVNKKSLLTEEGTVYNLGGFWSKKKKLRFQSKIRTSNLNLAELWDYKPGIEAKETQEIYFNRNQRFFVKVTKLIDERRQKIINSDAMMAYKWKEHYLG